MGFKKDLGKSPEFPGLGVISGGEEADGALAYEESVFKVSRGQYTRYQTLLLRVEGADSGVSLLPREAENPGLASWSSLC